MKEVLWLRCYKCNYQFLATVNVDDKIFEIGCPKCWTKTVELDMGHKINLEQTKIWHFRYDTNNDRYKANKSSREIKGQIRLQ